MDLRGGSLNTTLVNPTCDTSIKAHIFGISLAQIDTCAILAYRPSLKTKHDRSGCVLLVRRRMIWNIRGDFGAEVIGSSGSGYAALR
jgi:hypothetical protein